jgi:eukaryotic-like serine/threonine-protein kinase
MAGSETFASSALDELPTVTSLGLPEAQGDADLPRPSPGQVWGTYRIGAVLGRGGMGEVYEAEHTGSGRRVALKVLRGRLDHADRARFLREGQLAASISHPHTVYIYGSEEIGGMPVITMELLPGGTLKDRVAAEGPLPIDQAVAAVLDIIGGLDAAQAALESCTATSSRRIASSNTTARSRSATSGSRSPRSHATSTRRGRRPGFEGTPQFAPPEQLRGEPLDVRADIYAVGATFYYLLTGHPPFEAPDLTALVGRVTSEPPSSPRSIRRDVPPGLAEVVLRCLAKTPAERPPSYAALAEALRPFAPRAHRPAPLGLRVVAGFVDAAILAVPVAAWSTSSGSGEAAALLNWGFGVGIHLFYYLLFEGVWGASPGKRLLGLQVMSIAGRPATLAQVALRTFIFLAGTFISGAPVVARFGPSAASGVSADRAMPLLVLALIFVTMRRRNGWAGLHEILSRTRVMTRVTAAATAVGRTDPLLMDLRPVSHGRCGPFVLLEPPRPIDHGELSAAFDPQLRRRVWIHRVPAGTAAIAAPRRDAARTTRLRWLTGRRGIENWDAYEAPDGDSFQARASRPVEWSALKRWLTDLGNELAAAQREGSLPMLGLDRLWVRDDGRLVLADFPVTRADGESSAPVSPAALLSSVLSACVGDRAVHEPAARTLAQLPLSARLLWRRLEAAVPPDIQVVRDEIAGWASAPERVDGWRRAVPMGLAAAPVIILAVSALVLLPSLARFANPDMGVMLGFLADLARPPGDGRLTDADRAALERYVAGRYASQLTDDTFWNSAVMQNLGELRAVADDVRMRHPDVSATEVEQLSHQLAPHIERAETHHRAQAAQVTEGASVVVTTLVAAALLFVLACSVTSALAVPGGVTTRLLGLAVVDREGRQIGRARSLARVVIAWSPAVAWLVYLLMSAKLQGWVPNPGAPVMSTIGMLGLLAAGAASVFL